MPVNGKLTKDEILYIQENCLSKTDEELAQHLNRHIKTIMSCRKKLGIIKSGAGQIKEILKPNEENLHASQLLTEEQRKSFFKTQLANSLFYSTLKTQFTKDEVDFYLEEWGSLCVQFEDVVATEKRQIDELIKIEIMGNRILRNIKITEDELEKIIKEVEEFRKKNANIDTDELAQERDNQLTTMIRSFSGQTEAMSMAYQRNVDAKQRILDELNARRKDRIDQIKKGGTTFISLVESLRDRENRAKEGRYLELVKMAKDKKKADWHEPKMFPDGTSDCILLDDKANIKEKEYRTIRDKSYLFSKYAEAIDRRILVIDHNTDREAFFTRYLNKNKLDLYTDASKIKFIDSYNCVMLDSENNNIVLDIIDRVLKEGLWQHTDILIHSDNADFVRNALLKLAGKRKIEVCSYSELSRQG